MSRAGRSGKEGRRGRGNRHSKNAIKALPETLQLTAITDELRLVHQLCDHLNETLQAVEVPGLSPAKKTRRLFCKQSAEITPAAPAAPAVPVAEQLVSYTSPEGGYVGRETASKTMAATKLPLWVQLSTVGSTTDDVEIHNCSVAIWMHLVKKSELPA